MLSTNTNRRIPVIYYVDDFEDTLDVARSYFKNKGVIFQEMHTMNDAYKETGKRMPTLVVISTSLNDPNRWLHRLCFQTMSVLRQSRKGINMVTIAKDYRQDDLIDSQREGAREHHDFSLDALERILKLAHELAEEDGPSGTEEELNELNRMQAGEDRSGVEAGDLQALRSMIYSVVREVFEDVLHDMGKPTPPTPRSSNQQVSVYQYN
jgi:DNA-binding NtrC family response regulator